MNASLLAVLLPLILIEVGLLVWAVVDLVKRKHVRGGNKLIWALVIIFISTLGPILYLVWGREE
ncbi:MAG: PLD nuclease N-terminal domain-containing protein [Thermoleophilia bacterium]